MTPILRHACMGSGACCHGSVVRLLPGEAPRLRALARDMGLPDPVDPDGHLAKADGACLFLSPEGRCEVHLRRGPAAKPRVCQQFPLVVMRAEDGPRAGIDPACATAIATWRGGPPLPEGEALATRVPLDEAEQALEHRVLDLLELDGQTLAGVLMGLVRGRPGPDGLPEGFAGRWVDLLRRLPLESMLTRDGMGRELPAALRPLLLARARWIPMVPPRGPGLSPEAEAWAVEAMRRVVWLRLNTHALRHPPTVALLAASGALALGWTHGPDDAAFGRALAAWLKAMRSPAFLQGFPNDLHALVAPTV